MTIQLKLSAP